MKSNCQTVCSIAFVGVRTAESSNQMPDTNRRPSPIRVAFPLCHLGMLLLWALWEAACRCSALCCGILGKMCLLLPLLCFSTGLWGPFAPLETNRANHPQHPLPCSVPPACSPSASWGQRSLTTNNSCKCHRGAGV